MKLDLFPIAAILVDRNGIIRCANASATSMFGFAVDEMAGLAVDVLLTKAFQNRHRAKIQNFLTLLNKAKPPRASLEFRVCRKDKTTFLANISISTIDDDEETFAFICINDLTGQIFQRSALNQARRAFHFLSGSNRTLLRATEIQPLLDEICRLATETGGYRLAWIGYAQHDERKLVHPVAKAGVNLEYIDNLLVTWADDETGRGPVGTAIRTSQRAIVRSIETNQDFAMWRHAARAYGFQSVLALPLLVNNKVFGALALYSDAADAFDVEEVKLLAEVADDLAFGIEVLRTRAAHDEANKKLRRLAYTDSVTGLPNRTHLLEFLDGAFVHQQGGALLSIMLKHLREINDTQGYLVANAALKEAGERLASTLQTGDMLARIGDEEFALVIPGGDEAAAARTATAIAEALRTTFQAGEEGIILGAKVGIALYPGGRATPNEVCADASLASRDTKANGTGGYQFYSPGMSTALMEQRKIAHALKHALAHNGLHLHYQPKIDLRSGQLAGAEALLRWNDPVLGQVAPSDFIPIAEEWGLMPSLGIWVLKEACQQLSRWKQAGLHLSGRLAINISARLMGSACFLSASKDIVKDSGCCPTDIEMEITESVMMFDGPSIIALIKEYNDLGFEFSIDDFGTGFSSLAYLSRFPAGTIKIDISFVRNMLKHQKDYIIVQTIIGMAKSLGLATVAEGVETMEQARVLSDLGCMAAQGYHYGRPEPSDSFARLWLKQAST